MRMQSLAVAGLIAGGLIGATGQASAHITFENREVTAGSTVKFVLRLPHGCAGSATTRVRIELPEVLHGAKPQLKPGWTVEIQPQPGIVAASAGGHGHGQAAGLEPRELSWSGRLEDAYYDELVFRASIDRNAAPGPLYVPVIQECEQGVDRWIAVPGPGQSADDLPNPAPSVRILPPS